jgi:hypothetical protein
MWLSKMFIFLFFATQWLALSNYTVQKWAIQLSKFGILSWQSDNVFVIGALFSLWRSSDVWLLKAHLTGLKLLYVSVLVSDEL